MMTRITWTKITSPMKKVAVIEGKGVFISQREQNTRLCARIGVRSRIARLNMFTKGIVYILTKSPIGT